MVPVSVPSHDILVIKTHKFIPWALNCQVMASFGHHSVGINHNVGKQVHVCYNLCICHTTECVHTAHNFGNRGLLF